LKAVEQWEMGRKVQGRVMEGVELTKARFTHRGEMRNPFEH
jgi:hypothetical protein